MYKKILVLLLFFSLSSAICAQNNSAGICAGYNVSFFSGSNWDKQVNFIETRNNVNIDQKVLHYFSCGVFYDRVVSSYIRLNTQLDFSAYGCNYPFKVMNVDVRGEIRKYVLELPVMINLTFAKPNGFYISAGPVVQFLINQYSWKEISNDITMNYSIKPENDFILSLQSGIGYILNKEKRVYKLELKYTRNITYALSSEDLPPDTNSIMILFSYGWRF